MTEIKFADAVKEGKKIVTLLKQRTRKYESENDKDQWRLGEIVASLEPKYGEHTLTKYGEQIGLSFKTVVDYRRVFLGWKDEKSGRPDFSVGRELVNHPKKAEIIKLHPDMTHREAREVAKKQKAATKKKPVLNMNHVANRLRRWLDQTFKQQKYLELSKAVSRYAGDIEINPRQLLLDEIQGKMDLLANLVSKIEGAQNENETQITKGRKQIESRKTS